VIRAYPAAPTVTAGQTLTLHISTDAPRFRIAFFRCGKAIERQEIAVPWFRGECAPSGDAGRPWMWPHYDIDVPPAWRAGVYIAAMQTDPPQHPVRADVTGTTLDARSGRALFVVRRRHVTAGLLVVLPLFTYHAYNVADVDGTRGHGEGNCLYSGSPWVSLHRPGGGIGGHPWDEVNEDWYDMATPRQTFAHWDGKSIAWLESQDYAYDCCTDLELHNGSVDLSAYAVVTSFGHHEYWTQSMRDRVESFIARGGHVAFFGGNTCWFRAEFDAQRQAIHRAGRWSEVPEWKMTGVSYAFGGGKWVGGRPPSGYHVTNARHWIYEGLNLGNGDVFGSGERLIGYECDGAPPESQLEILAHRSVRNWPVSDGSGELSQAACATLGTCTRNGTVFTASTVDWARVLACGEPSVTRITRNVLDRFLKNWGRMTCTLIPYEVTRGEKIERRA
jgi:hypothetical protein